MFSYLSGFFLIIDDIHFASYADDNTIYCAGNSIDDVILARPDSAQNVFQWFSDNQMKETRKNDKTQLEIGDSLRVLPRATPYMDIGKPEAVVQRCSVKKGVLKNFAKITGKHLCQSLFYNKVAGLTTGLFHRTPLVAASGKRRLLLNAFFNAQFNYCPCGCSTAVAITRRSNTYVKDISDLSAMIKAVSAFIDHNNI